MKLRVWWIPIFILMLVWPNTGKLEAAGTADIRIYLDGALLSADAPPYIKPGADITMVPLRVISEGLGARVAWSQPDKTATIEKEGNTIILTSGAASATVNGETIQLDASVEISGERTMVPLRFVSEQLGLTVDWNNANRTIALSSGTGGGATRPEPNTDALPADTSLPPSASDSSADELRGVWISTVFNLDWPTKGSYGKADEQQAEYIKLLDEVQAMGMNAVFVQVRPEADAIYPSKLVPWSAYLTGTAGKDPGYDPLQFLIEETHRRGMEFHAWFNPFRASTGSDAGKLPPNHVAKEHPDWIVKYSDKLYINPGVPQAREHVIAAIMEVVEGYDIDGVHLDDYFYPTGETANKKFNDDETYRAYNAQQLKDKGDWRRDNINRFVEQLGQSINQAKPDVSFGISPFGVWRNKAVDITGSDTRAGVTTYDDMYADVRTWIKREWIDYVAPQIYWSLSREEVRYDLLTSWWAGEVKGTNVKLYIGHAPYKLGTPEIGWSSAQEIINQLDYNRQVPEVRGSIFFSAKDLRKNPLGLVPLLQAYYGQ